MKSVLVRGPLLSESGYGNHARQVFRWLVKHHPSLNIVTQVLPWGTTSWHVNPDSERGLIKEVMKRTGNVEQKFDVSFQIQLPNEWDPRLANFNVGITAVVESDLCNPAWITACNSMDAIIVPSQFCKKTLVNTGTVNPPIYVIPESFIPEVLDQDKKFDIDFETDFNFLLLGTLTGNNPYNDRKNLFFAIKWICEEFANDPDVGIILKTNAGRGTRTDWPNIESMFKKVINEVRKGPYPRIHIIHGIVPNSSVAGLYVHPKVKMLVAPTRGEGFGLPILEAAASGLPVAATEYSGHMDFMKLGKFTKFEYDLRPIHETRVDGNIWIKDTKWAEVKEVDFKKKLRKFKSSHEVPKQWARDLALKLKETHSPDSIDNEYEKNVGHILK